MFAQRPSMRAPQTKTINGFCVEIVFKRVRNINMRLRTGSSSVYISAPARVPMREIEAFVVSKSSWLQKNLTKMQVTVNEIPLEFKNGETHFVWGRPLTLQIVEKRSRQDKATFDLTHLYVPLSDDDQSKGRCAHILDKWYRTETEQAVTKILPYWEQQTGKTVHKMSYRAMRSRWGSCMISDKHIRLNTELAKRHPSCLEYVLVHEITHLFERGHNARFYGFMDLFLPDWKARRQFLNQPLDSLSSMPS